VAGLGELTVKLRSQVSPEKLRGGFYTPDDLVDACYQRVSELLRTADDSVSLLEPSIGDGAFIRGLHRQPWLAKRLGRVTAFELLDAEAEKSRALLEAGQLVGTVRTTSVLPWAASTDDHFDIAVGNPPFVRFQFVDPEETAAAAQLATRLGVKFGGVSNLWLPVLLGALSRLRQGGVFSFVVPIECFTGISASVFRSWVSAKAEHLTVDLFEPGSFPGVLQEVIVLSGRRVICGDRRMRIVDHHKKRTREWSHALDGGSTSNWTGLVLDPQHLEALDVARNLPAVVELNSIARFSVATVTGANDFFSVDADTAREFQLIPWCLPLLPRIRHATGLRYTHEDEQEMLKGHAKAHLLTFSSDRPDPLLLARPSEYLDQGVKVGLPGRYKCRIRKPWYRVPVVPTGDLLLSKRSHRYPRLVLNEAGAYTTDTIYRGFLVDDRYAAPDVAAAFHSSLTLLSAELEGRSFGGGVLELVPSEVGRLLIAVPPNFGRELERFDAVVRSSGTDSEDLVTETDRFLIKAGIGINQELVDCLADARSALLSRRLERNS
jgi:adenine-specific DNA-methyltransferase